MPTQAAFDRVLEKNRKHALHRIILAVDVAVFAVAGSELKVLLVEMQHEPFLGKWALPGRTVWEQETVADTARRVSQEFAGQLTLHVEELQTFSEPDRDPRSRAVSVAHLALTPAVDKDEWISSTGRHLRWFALNALPPLAYDHHAIVQAGARRLKDRAPEGRVMQYLLPEYFTLSQIRAAFEAILGKPICNKRNFRRFLMSRDLIEETDLYQTDVFGRPPKLHRVKKSSGATFF